ncbi:MAG: phasin family protein [Acidobacteriota bacterium]
MLGVAELQDKVVDSVRQIWLAGLGAAVLTQEEGSKLFDTLVHKGQEAEKQGSSPVTMLKDRATSTWDTLSQKVDEQIASSLHRMGVPTREEIATLTRRVDALIVSVDKLRAKTLAVNPEATVETGVQG